MTAAIVTVTLNPAIDHTALVPNFRAGEVNRVTWEQADPGGKGVNVASFLADFGLSAGFSVTATGILGQENARIFEDLFDRKGIRSAFVKIPGRTRTNIKVVDEVQDQVTDINFPGLAPDDAAVQTLHETIDALAQTHDWFILSGSLPAAMATSIYADLIKRLKAQGKTVVLDASGASLRQAIGAAPFMVKPNIEELQEAIGRSLPSLDDRLEAARELLAQGIAAAVISLGADGALFVETEAAVWARPPKIEVISTVGAGDAMVSGFVTGKLHGFDLCRCARLATAFSIGALSQVGPRLPPQEVIESFMEQVSIEDLHHP